MFKYFTANSTYRYVDILQEIVSNYNNTKHSVIGITPAKASEGDKVKQCHHVSRLTKPKFKVGDRVRIAKIKSTFEKGYTPRWTEEVFTISDVKDTFPPTYKIADYNNSKIQGSFYEPELQHTSQEVFRVEKVIKRKGNKSLVKWLRYDDSFNSWVSNKGLKLILTE